MTPKKILLAILGVFFILLGIVGLIMPILPGWIFIFIGLGYIAPRLAARLKWRFFRRRFKKDLVYFDHWLKKGVEAGFTTRHFDLRLQKTDDLLAEEQQNTFTKLFAASEAVAGKFLQPLEKIVLLRQVHGDTVAVLDDPAKFEKPGFYPMESSDAAISCVPRLTLLVFSADCLSIFYSAGDWVGLAHAGWRGTKAGIAAKTLKMISERSGVAPSAVRIIFGPRIGPSAYEVGPEFREFFPKSSLKVRKKQGKQSFCFDISQENKRQLIAAGARPNRITDHGICTVTQNSDLYSFRKEGEKAGRLISFITKA